MTDARTDRPDRATGERTASRPTSSPGCTRWPTTGHYPIRGLGARRKLPTFDDLVFLTASVSRYPLEGYRERCDTATTLGTRHGTKPIRARHPHHHRRHELRRPLGHGQGGPGPGRHRGRHVAPPPATAA